MRRPYSARYGMVLCASILAAFMFLACGSDGEHDATVVDVNKDGNKDAGNDARDSRSGDADNSRGNETDAGVDGESDETSDGSVSCPVTCQLGKKECFEGGVRQCVADSTAPECNTWKQIQKCDDSSICDASQLKCVPKPLCGNDCKPFSLILLPDTQYYTNKKLAIDSKTYKKQTEWVVKNVEKYNIKYVFHLGDITNNNRTSEWAIAKEAHEVLHKKNIAYSVVTGNHDYKDPNTGKYNRSKSLFNKYFGHSKFKDRKWYGGRFGKGEENINNYGFFSVGGLKFMVLSLEFAPRADIIAWANKLIADHQSHYVIIATHCYLGKTGRRTSNCDAGASGPRNGTGGEELWNKLVRKHRNIMLVASGHIGGARHRKDQGEHKNWVYQMLVDYQFEANCTSDNQKNCKDNCRNKIYTGNGWMRRIEIDPLSGVMKNFTFTVEQTNPKFFGKSASLSKNRLFCSGLNNNSKYKYYAESPSDKTHHTPVFNEFSFTPKSLLFQPGNSSSAPFHGLAPSASDETPPFDLAAVADSDGTFKIVWQDYVGVDNKLPVVSRENQPYESLESPDVEEDIADDFDDEDDYGEED